MVAAAFGLAVESALPLPWSVPVATAPARRVRIEAGSGRPPAAETLNEHRDADGTLLTRFSATRGGDYVIDGRAHGCFVVTRDGGRIQVFAGDADAPAWERYLVGHALPLAAVLQGIEVFHASAVRSGGSAIGLVGGSGAGKSSLSLALTIEGAEFLADDVLALEPAPGGIVAHPGVPVVNVREGALQDVSEADRDAATSRLPGADVERRLVARRGAAAPLSALLYIDRDARHDAAALEPMTAPDPRLLLASTYSFLVGAAARLERQLDVCARIASSVPVYWLRLPANGVTPRATARWLLERLDGVR